VAFSAPFTTLRYLFPFRPIPAAPLGLADFSQRGLYGFEAELLWIWVPTALIVGAVGLLRAYAAINALYGRELRLLQNLFLPSVKLVRKERVGARLRRRYDAPRTPLERVLACADIDHAKVAALVALRDRLDPFVLAATIDRQLEAIFALANHRQSPARAAAAPSPAPPAPPPPPPPKTPHWLPAADVLGPGRDYDSRPLDTS